MASPAVPEVLPIFPLTGVLLLPGMWLPLHIFEPRYRHMVEDALQASMHIGMVQPRVPREDNRPLKGAEQEIPDVYPVGCVGRIDNCKREEDGRFLITLQGVQRFRIVEELPLFRGYRRVRADYGPFGADAATAPQLDTAPLLLALQAYGQANRLPFDLNRLRGLSGAMLVNGLSMSLPFAPVEKQALLEAADLETRYGVLSGLMAMGSKPSATDAEHAPPTVN